MNEWEFTAAVAGWIKEILGHNSSLPFAEVRCEQVGLGSAKRRDLTLYDANNRVVLTGEIKLPYQKDGGTPFNQKVLLDARYKALNAKSNFFFTWNVNEFVLWEVSPTKTAFRDQNYKTWEVTRVLKEHHLELPMTVQAIKKWLADFLTEFAGIVLGTAAVGVKAPDEKFIDLLDSSLNSPIYLNLERMLDLYRQPGFKKDLDRWMVKEEPGRVFSSQPEHIQENLERTTQFACYALVNKIVFYEALLKRHKGRLGKLEVPEHISEGDALRLHLAGYFEKAKEVTGDYETVFGEDYGDLGNRIPFYADHAVPHWRELVNQIQVFDFSKLNYEIIGGIFERLISPEERSKRGQFYTRVEVVDLINSFCIRRGDEKVMDPACGGGTFLVRAYARKRELKPSRKHAALLSDLYGVDISAFPAHLSTINLATRDLVDDENYPQIACGDFFDVKPRHRFLILPQHVKSRGLGRLQYRELEVPALDAVVGNPPHIRREDILKTKKNVNGGPEKGTNEFYRKLVKEESGLELSGRSDIHCYFWPHAANFLKENGFLGFLTSSQWLDVEYGFRLQQWMLANFRIVAIIESFDEPWFVGARVATAVTVLERSSDATERMENTVRFVQLLRPIGELLAHDGTTVGAVTAANRLRNEILALTEDVSDARFRARLVRQRDLWEQGVRLGVIMGKTPPPEDDDDDEGKISGEYYGGKWGIYLRAPDLWFDLLKKYGDKFAPLGDIANIHRGITSGKDDFFFPQDASAECLEASRDKLDFEDAYGVPRKDVASGKVKLVKCGAGRGEIRPLEAKYLEPEVHSLMEIGGFTVAPEDCKRMILLVGKSKSELKDRYVSDYIKWGEQKNYHNGSTCASRASKEREWYDLTGHKRGALFWSMAQQYRHIVPANDSDLICNHNLFDITPHSMDNSLLGGVLNSSWVVFSKFLFGRPVGVEGNYKTEIIDVNMMLVPNPLGSASSAQKRVIKAFEKLKERKAMQFLSERRMRAMAYRKAGKEEALAELSDICELDMKDRRELDDAVLEMIGVSSVREREKLIDELYAYLREFFELTRQKEEKAIENKTLVLRRGKAQPGEVAAELFAELKENEPQLLRRYEPDFLDLSLPFDTFELPAEGAAEAVQDSLFNAYAVKFHKGRKKAESVETKNAAQGELLALLANSGLRGLARAPRDEEECLRVFAAYEKFLRIKAERLRDLVAERTGDEELQEKILTVLGKMME